MKLDKEEKDSVLIWCFSATITLGVVGVQLNYIKLNNWILIFDCIGMFLFGWLSMYIGKKQSKRRRS